MNLPKQAMDGKERVAEFERYAADLATRAMEAARNSPPRDEDDREPFGWDVNPAYDWKD